MPILSLTIPLHLTLAIVVASSVISGDDIPEPSFDRIDYSRPETYLVLHESFGDAERIRRLAATIESDSPETTLSAIDHWMQANLSYDAKTAYTWRNFDSALETKVYGGCADHALVFAAMARASGIPTVFVKTMDADWIREFRATGTCTSWRGHVFLEIFLDGHWRLLDASAMTLYDEYEPSMRILPGDRYAYDKGSDPYQLLLSLDWERWKVQTAKYFGEFELARLPVGAGRDISARALPLDVYITADSPVYQILTERCHTLGYRVRGSFNTDFDVWLAKASGSFLVVTCVGDRIVLPESDFGRYLPLPVDDLRERVTNGETGVLRKRLDDGTKVVLLYASDVPKIVELIHTLDISPVK